MEHSTAENNNAGLERPAPQTNKLLIILAGAVLAMAALWVYSNTLSSPFVFDDVPFIQRNANIAVSDLSLDSLKNAAFDSTRPLANLSFALNHYFSGGNEAAYHMVNIVLHFLAGLGMYYLLLCLLAVPGIGQKNASSQWAPFLAALLWLVHPVHTGAVTYIVQRSAVMASMFCLWSMAMYIKARLSARGKGRKYWVLSVVLWMLALAGKEIALALPFAALVFEWFFFQDLRKDWAGKFALILGGFLAASVIGAYLFLGSHPLDSILYDYKNFDFTLKERLLTEPRVLVYYLSLLAFPYPGRLTLDYDIPHSQSLLNPATTIYSILFMAGLIAAALLLARKRRLVSYAILWFCITLFLESSFIPLDLAFEHRLYLPSVFPIFAVAALLLSKENLRKPAIASLLCIAVIFGVWTHQRNTVWQSDVALWRDTVAKVPENARAHNNLGLALAHAGRDDDAFKEFQKAVELKPDFAQANYNIGISLGHQEEHEKAIPYFEKAVEKEPENVLYLNDLALAYMGAGRLEDAITRLYQALRIEPEYAPTHNNLGVALGGQAMVTQALEHFRKAVEIYPDYADAHRNLGILLGNLDNHPKAIAEFEKVIKLLPRDPQANFLLGRSYAAVGKYEKAVLHFRETLQAVPDYIPALYNIGLIYMGQEKYVEAAKFFEKILKIKPENMQASKQLKKCIDEARANVQAQKEPLSPE
ncbi:tetratricopeptide repeat protein [Desulfatibacillum aliphaticivorans]|uniref:tetratricopeptide repeat protein n=1 Tax=Desulfatibacillum aliphaticivorans TaxID=218208 RepID=UPI0004295D48|nr:tetratricopeptide repeat protein [Desulfatibacillum aliphaticivorans]